jgi:hypothetical protein
MTAGAVDEDFRDPSSARVLLVERAGSGVLGLVVARHARRPGAAAVFVAGPADAPQPIASEDVALPSGVRDRRLGQDFASADPLYLNVADTGCAQLAVVVAPAGSQARLSTSSQITAAGRREQVYRPVPLSGGLAVLPLDAPGSTGAALQVLSAGRVVAERRFSLRTPTEPTWPPADQLARAIRQGRGTVDAATAEDAFGFATTHPLRGVTLGRPEVIWGATQPAKAPLVLVATVFESGARFVTDWYRKSDGSSGSSFAGVLPAGALEHRVFSWVNNADGGLVIVAVRGVRAEVVRTDDSVSPVALSGGGAVVPPGKPVKAVRGYDADGALIEERAPGTGLLDLPGSM